jgi:hypothetical protein
LLRTLVGVLAGFVRRRGELGHRRRRRPGVRSAGQQPVAGLGEPPVEVTRARPEAEPVVQPPDGRSFGEHHHAPDPAVQDRPTATADGVS